MAICKAPLSLLQTEHLRLYERLGDALLKGDTAVDAYHKAIGNWRGAVGQDPLVGARLLRKLLMTYTRLEPLGCPITTRAGGID